MTITIASGNTSSNGNSTIKSQPIRSNNRFLLCFHQTRYLMLLLVTLCLSLVWSNVLTFNFTGNHVQFFAFVLLYFTVICMQPLNVGISADHDYLAHKTTLIIVVALGAILFSYPISVLLTQFGTRSTFTAIGLLSAVSTAFIPLASEFGLSLFVVCRFGQGMAFIGCFPVIGTIVTNWASLKQNAISLAICTSFLQIAPSITNPLASALCLSSAGWPAVYYIHAAMTFVLFALFAVFYRNHPGKHPLVGARELTRISTGKSAMVTKKATTAVPYGAIMRTATVWAVWVAAVGAFFSTNLVLLYAPTYLNKVMNFPVSLTGVSSALPPFIQFIVKLISGLLSDKISCIRERYKIRIWNTMALCGQAVFFVALSFVPDSQPILALVLLICAQSSLGFNTGGFYKVATLVSRQFSGFVMANVALCFCVGMLIVPFIVQAIAVDNTVAEWRILFFIIAIILVACNVFFCVFADDQPAVWTKEPPVINIDVVVVSDPI